MSTECLLSSCTATVVRYDWKWQQTETHPVDRSLVKVCWNNLRGSEQLVRCDFPLWVVKRSRTRADLIWLSRHLFADLDKRQSLSAAISVQGWEHFYYVSQLSNFSLTRPSAFPPGLNARLWRYPLRRQAGNNMYSAPMPGWRLWTLLGR